MMLFGHWDNEREIPDPYRKSHLEAFEGSFTPCQPVPNSGRRHRESSAGITMTEKQDLLPARLRAVMKLIIGRSGPARLSRQSGGCWALPPCSPRQPSSITLFATAYLRRRRAGMQIEQNTGNSLVRDIGSALAEQTARHPTPKFSSFSHAWCWVKQFTTSGSISPSPKCLRIFGAG